MEGGRRQGRPEEELFFASPQTPSNSEPVAPLRIQKREGASPSARTSSVNSHRESGAAQQATFSPPPASASPPSDQAPHSDDRPVQQSTNRLPYPDGPRQGSPADNYRGRSSTGSGRPKFDANDPNRPTLSGYAAPPTMGQSVDASVQPGKTGDWRGAGAKPSGAPSSGSPASNNEELFQRAPQRQDTPGSTGRKPSNGENPNPFPEYHQQYWPPEHPQQPKPQSAAAQGLSIPNPTGVNRLSSTASTSTTRAQRGSPPPPETPVVGPPAGGIEARYAAAGIAGTSTLNSLQAQNAAASQRSNQYSVPPRTNTSPPVQPPQFSGPPRSDSHPPPQTQPRPWTPTEQPGTQPHGPPRVYQGMNEVSAPPQGNLPQPPQQTQNAPPQSEQPLEHDFQRMNMNEEPPPAYSSVTQGGGAGYPNDKQTGGSAAATAAAAGAAAGAAAAGVTAGPSQPLANQAPQGHPAFANDHQAEPAASQPGPNQSSPVDQAATSTPGPGPASPPPLPEGWIAHLDPNSGQYYYIHLPSQSTQWEFPKGPTPLNLQEPSSPTGTLNPLASPSFAGFAGKSGLASPGFPPQQATFHEGQMSMAAAVSSPTAAGFTGPPPVSGVDTYKVQPTNGVYFGPYLRYTNMDLERGLWLGSILIVTDGAQAPTIHIHQSVDLSPNPRQLKANPIFTHRRWMFYRYDIDLTMEESGVKWTYAITSHLGCTRYEFLVAGRHETSWRFIAHSGNDFALNVNANERTRLGGVGFMWKDILQKHVECGGFHAQLGLGDQIYADRLWKEIPLLRQWTATSGKDNRKNAAWSAQHDSEVSHAYFHYYTSHFDQPHLREAFAQIPHILSLDDHDIFDGFGSYPEYMQFSNMFKNIGRIGIEMYLLFQHHTTLEILKNVSNDMDLFTITGTGWHFIKYLGPAVVVVGPDTRSERNPHQVMAGPTYQGLFPKIATLPPCVQHCVWMIPVPIIYPRLESMEHLASTMATGKKAVTGTFNMLGKVTSSVAGVVGAKGVVGDGFSSVKKAVGKSGLMSGVLSPFGEIDVLDELRDQWTHESKDLERTYLIRTLQGISHNKSLRMTFFSGDVNCCGAGLVHDPAHPSDHKTMYQIISSSVVNTPPGSYVLRLLHNNKPLFVPANGHRSNQAPSDTKEDMMEIFTQDVNGQPRELKKLMGRRNYVACVAYDPELVNGTFGQTMPGQGSGRLSLAVDFMVQNEGTYGAPMKYGPVIVPSLEYGK